MLIGLAKLSWEKIYFFKTSVTVNNSKSINVNIKMGRESTIDCLMKIANNCSGKLTTLWIGGIE